MRDSTDPIVRRKLWHEVFDRLKAMITRGELAPGDAMPSERDLMDRFGVGRPAIREAMQALANMGLITISHGERARVRQLTARSIIQQVDLTAHMLLSASPDSLEHLKQARRFFERGMVREAAEKATESDVTGLEETLRDQGGKLDDPAAFSAASRLGRAPRDPRPHPPARSGRGRGGDGPPSRPVRGPVRASRVNGGTLSWCFYRF